MSTDNFKIQIRKGLLEFCVLQIISRGEVYTSDIIDELKKSEIIVVEGTLYPLLNRLKASGYVDYKWRESNQGPPRKYYVLTVEGTDHLSQLKISWKEIDNIELVIVSPLKRTLETASIIFEGKNIPIIALDICREYPLGNHTCNKRSNKEELELLYPNINFNDLKSNRDNIWSHKIENIESLNNRIILTKKFIKNRKENNIAFINHSSFIGQMKDNYIKYLDNGGKYEDIPSKNNKIKNAVEKELKRQYMVYIRYEMKRNKNFSQEILKLIKKNIT